MCCWAGSTNLNLEGFSIGYFATGWIYWFGTKKTQLVDPEKIAAPAIFSPEHRPFWEPPNGKEKECIFGCFNGVGSGIPFPLKKPGGGNFPMCILYIIYI